MGEEDHLNASSLSHSPSSFASSHTLTGGPNVEVMVRWYLFIFFFVCGLAQFRVCSTGSREKTAHATRIIGLRGFFSLAGLIWDDIFISLSTDGTLLPAMFASAWFPLRSCTAVTPCSQGNSDHNVLLLEDISTKDPVGQAGSQ